MSTISVDNIEDKSAVESVGTENVIHGTVKAWALIDQVSGAADLDASFNCSSATDNGTGRPQANLTNAFTGTTTRAQSSSCNDYNESYDATNSTAGAIGMAAWNASHVANDNAWNHMMTVGPLA